MTEEIQNGNGENGLVDVTEEELAKRAGIDETSFLEGNFDRAEVIRQLRPGEYVVKEFFADASSRILENCLERLKQAGLDIGKENAEYGSKMPLPEKDDEYRELRIFKRR